MSNSEFGEGLLPEMSATGILSGFVAGLGIGIGMSILFGRHLFDQSNPKESQKKKPTHEDDSDSDVTDSDEWEDEGTLPKL